MIIRSSFMVFTKKMHTGSPLSTAEWISPDVTFVGAGLYLEERWFVFLLFSGVFFTSVFKKH